MWLRFFFFNDTATTEIYTLSLHDALPISRDDAAGRDHRIERLAAAAAVLGEHELRRRRLRLIGPQRRSEEHTSELQSQSNLVCRLLLEKKKTNLLVRDSMIAARDEVLSVT